MKNTWRATDAAEGAGRAGDLSVSPFLVGGGLGLFVGEIGLRGGKLRSAGFAIDASRRGVSDRLRDDGLGFGLLRVVRWRCVCRRMLVRLIWNGRVAADCKTRGTAGRFLAGVRAQSARVLNGAFLCREGGERFRERASRSCWRASAAASNCLLPQFGGELRPIAPIGAPGHEDG